MAAPVIEKSDLVEVRNSPLHGLGVFATRAIKKGTRVIEYIGERVSHGEADRRYETKDDTDNHTFLFSVDRGVVIDAGVQGNDARYFNHSCDPNCESVIEDRRVFIESIKDIEPGDEMTYDYQIGRERDDPPNIDEIYACRCGAKECRGTMLWPTKRPGRAKARKKAPLEKRSAASKGAKKQAKGGSRVKRKVSNATSRSEAKGRLRLTQSAKTEGAASRGGSSRGQTASPKSGANGRAVAKSGARSRANGGSRAKRRPSGGASQKRASAGNGVAARSRGGSRSKGRTAVVRTRAGSRASGTEVGARKRARA